MAANATAAPTTATQAVISTDTQKLIDGTTTPFTLEAWYLLGAQNVTKFIASKDVGGTFTDLAASDYDLDTELGAVRFHATGTNTLTGAEKISCLYQAAAITTAPIIALASVPPPPPATMTYLLASVPPPATVA